MEVLVIRQSAYGDILHLLPALAAMKQAVPGTRLSLLVKERFRGVARMAPFIDEVLTEPGPPVDLVVDCQGLLRTAWLSLRCRAPVRAGLSWRDVREKPAALFYNRRVRVKAAHVIDMQAELLAGALGREVRVDRNWRAVFLAREDPAVAAFLSAVPRPRALLHPFSSQAGKHLRPEEWRPVLADLRRRGWSLMLSHGPGEEGLLGPWREAAPGAVTVPLLPLESLGALVSGCRLMVGADTGILHLADQLGVPCLSWFSLWHPERNGPYFSPNLVFWRRPPVPDEIGRWLDRLP